MAMDQVEENAQGMAATQLVAELKAWGWFLRLDERESPVSLHSGTGHFREARIFLLIFSLIWTGICVALFKADAEGFLRMVFMVIGFFCWSGFVSLFKSSSVRFDDSSLMVVSNLLGLAFSKRVLAKRQIVGFEIDSTVTAGDTKYFRVQVDSIFGKKYPLANGVAGKERAEALVRLLRGWKDQGH